MKARYRFLLAASAAALPGLRMSSYSALRRAFSCLFILAITTAATTSSATNTTAATQMHAVTCSIDGSLIARLSVLWVLCALIALEIFHFCVLPGLRWVVRRFG